MEKIEASAFSMQLDKGLHVDGRPSQKNLYPSGRFLVVVMAICRLQPFHNMASGCDDWVLGRSII